MATQQALIITNQNKELFHQGLKKCSVCKKILPLSEFYVRKNKPRARCKHCKSLWGVGFWDNILKEAKEGNLEPILQYKLRKWKKRAKDKNIGFNLTVEYVKDLFEKQQGKCYYTGVHLNIVQKKKIGIGKGKMNKITFFHNPNHFSLDRLNSDKGYVKGNVVWCTYLINKCKNMQTVPEFYEMCENVLNYRRNNENEKLR